MTRVGRWRQDVGGGGLCENEYENEQVNARGAAASTDTAKPSQVEPGRLPRTTTRWLQLGGLAEGQARAEPGPNNLVVISSEINWFHDRGRRLAPELIK